MLKNIWDTSVEVEESNYYWKEKPKVNLDKTNKSPNYLHIDLFSGCGGFTEGFAQAGFSSAIAIDIHPPSLQTLQFNHPSTTTICGDIKKISSNLLKSHLPIIKCPVVITAEFHVKVFPYLTEKDIQRIKEITYLKNLLE